MLLSLEIIFIINTGLVCRPINYFLLLVPYKLLIKKRVFTACIVFLLILSCNNAQKNNSVNIKTRIFRNDTINNSNLTGFGYDILVNGKLYIHQPHIPAVSGSMGFATEEDARKTAEYVSEKLRSSNTLPALDKQELDNLGIKY